MSCVVLTNKEIKFDISFKLKPFIRRVLKEVGLQSGQIAFNFVDADKIVVLNQTYLHGDYVTDIITFNLGDTLQIEGDVYICIPQAQRQGEELGHGFEFELKTLIVHGILHLLGYEDYTDLDRAKMFAYQDDVLKKVA